MLAIFSALKEEIRPILDEMEILETVHLRPSVIFIGTYQNRDIIIAHTGMGFEKMERTVGFCIKEYSPSACINIGYCGALTPGLNLADIVIATSVVHEKINEQFEPDKNELFQKAVSACTNAELKSNTGTILSVDKVVATPHEKAYLGTKFGAIAVDMESFGLAKASQKLNAPFAVVRSVLDPMDIHLPEFPGTVSDDGTINPIQVATDLLSHPKNILSIPQLKFCASKARETLMRFVNEFIKL